MSSRMKKTGNAKIKSLAECDYALLRLGQIQADIKGFEARATRQIEKAKSSAAAEIGPLKAQAEGLLDALEAFVEEDRELHDDVLNGKKSRKLNHGTIGYRKKTNTKLPEDDQLIERLRESGYDDLVKIVEKPDTGAVRKLVKVADDHVRALLGVTVEIRDIFFAEPADSQVGERTAAQ